MDDRAEFEAWASHFFTRGELDRHGINGARPDEYRVLHIERMWGAWQAATQRQQERIAALEAQVQALSLDASRYRAFSDAGLPITFLGVEHYTTPDLDAAIDAAIARATHKEGA